MNKQVNLFIVGGQKCGTTALAHFMSQHPDICVALNKEAHLFDQPNFDTYKLTDIDKHYNNYFFHYAEQRYACDATPIYAYWQDIPNKIRLYNPDAKIILVVRDPIERAFSQYMMAKSRGQEHLNPFLAFLLEPIRMQLHNNREWKQPARTQSYLRRGKFVDQINNLYRVFPKDQVLVVHNSDLKHHHQNTLNRIFKFLDITHVAIPEKEVFKNPNSPAKDFWYWLARRYAKIVLRHHVNYIKSFKQDF